MSTKKIFLGTTEHTQNVPAPASGMRKTMTRTRISPTFLNGGAAVFGSAAARAEYAMDFGVQDPTDAEGLWKYNDFANGAHGNGFIYMHDPMIADQNVLGPQWANPALIEQGWKNICGQRIGFVPVDDNITRLMMTNLAAYGSFETAQSGAAVVRTNLHTNPRLAVGQSAFGAAGNTGVREAVSGIPDVQFTYRSTGEASPSGTRVYTSLQNLVVGATYSISAIIERLGQNHVVYVSTDTNNANSQTVSASATGTGLEEVFGTFVATRDLMYFHVRLASNATVTTTRSMTRILLEQTDQKRPFFDGASPNEKGFVTAWSGASNNSPSTMAAAVVTVRENTVPDPDISDSSNAKVWNGTGSGTSSASVVAAPDFPSARAVRNTWSAAASNSTGAAGYTNRIPVVAGQTYTFSIHARSNKVRNMVAEVQFSATSSGSLSNQASSATTVVPANTVARLSVTVTVPTGMAFVQILATSQAGTPGWAVGDYLESAGFMSEASPALGSYFSATTPNSGDFINGWSGAANASTSVQQGVQAEGARVNANGRLGILSWARSDGRGASALRVLNRFAPGFGAANTDTFSDLTSTTNWPSYAALAGKEITVAAWVSIDAPATGSTTGNARTIVLQVNGVTVGNGQYTNYTSVPNQAGRHLFRATMTVPAGGTNFAFIRLYNGSSSVNGHDVYWDDLTIVEGSHPDLMPFDGSSTNPDPDLNYVWTGTPFASTSEFRETFHPQPGLAPKTALWEIPATVPARTMRPGKNRSFTVPLPPGHTLHLGGAKGSATFNAGIYYDVIPVGSTTWQYGGEVVLGSPVDLPSFATKINGDQFRFVRIYVGRGTTNATGYLYLNALMGQVLENGRVPAVDRYLAGQGVSGMLFSNEATPQNYIMAKGRKRVGLSTTLLEVEQWMNPR